jgi:hypothetical protein
MKGVSPVSLTTAVRAPRDHSLCIQHRSSLDSLYAPSAHPLHTSPPSQGPAYLQAFPAVPPHTTPLASTADGTHLFVPSQPTTTITRRATCPPRPRQQRHVYTRLCGGEGCAARPSRRHLLGLEEGALGDLHVYNSGHAHRLGQPATLLSSGGDDCRVCAS